MRACLFVFIALALVAPATPVQARNAEALHKRYAELYEQLADNPFGRPVHVESSENGADHRGAIYAVVEHPFDRVAQGLRSAAQWCGVLVLQANVKHCEASDGGVETLSIFVARRPVDPLDRAHRVDLSYAVMAERAQYLRVALDSPEGPFGTADYRIRFQAAPIGERHTFLHLAYSYTLGRAARMGMSFYLSTSGRDKVGFSVVERTADGQPLYVEGVRGVIERTTMRYYLAIEAYLDTLEAPASARIERRLRAFHAGLESYPLQLRELELDEYLAIKRRDVARVLRAAGDEARLSQTVPSSAR
jgi:hypothetical protein